MKRSTVKRALLLILSLILAFGAVPVASAETAFSGAPSVSVKAGKESLTVKWTKLKGAKIYQLQYSDNKRFRNAKTVNVKNRRKYKIKNLASLKKYYVRVRAKGKKKSADSKWSAIRRAVTKAKKSAFKPSFPLPVSIYKNSEADRDSVTSDIFSIDMPEESKYESPVIPEGAEVSYYPSLYSAAQAVNGGEENNCAEAEAVCLMYKDGDSFYIEILKNFEEAESVTFNGAVSINLRKHTLSLADRKYITAKSDFSLLNGTVNILSSEYAVLSSATNSGGMLTVSGVKFNADISYAHSGTSVICSSALNNKLTKLLININGAGSSSYEFCGVKLNGTAKLNSSDLNNVRVNISLSKASEICGIKDSCITQNNKNSRVYINCTESFRGSATGIKAINVSYVQNVNIEKPDITVLTDNTATQYGINDARVNKDGEFNLTDAKVRVINGSGPARGVSVYGKNACITGGNIFAEETNNTTDGVGIFLNGYDGKNRYNQNITVIGNEEHPLEAYGKLSGILVRKGTYNILGGTYTSVDHTGYLAGNTTVRDAVFKIANRELYTKAQLTDSGKAGDSADAWGLYFGCQYSSVNTDVINMYNCIIGNEPSCGFDSLDNMSRAALSIKCGYIQPKEINLYDCDIYSGSRFVFRYVDAYKDSNYNMTTKFNLYGKTRIFNRAGNEFTKEEIRNTALNWRTTYPIANKSSTGSSEANNKYYVHNMTGGITKLIGYSYYAPAENSDMNDEIRDSYGTLSGAEKEKYLNADAVNVHDYRD